MMDQGKITVVEKEVNIFEYPSLKIQTLCKKSILTPSLGKAFETILGGEGGKPLLPNPESNTDGSKRLVWRPGRYLPQTGHTAGREKQSYMDLDFQRRAVNLLHGLAGHSGRAPS